MNREQILAVYHQGPEAVVQLVTELYRQMERLQARVEQLEARTKKTAPIAIYLLPRIWRPPTRYPHGRSRGAVPEGSRDIAAAP